MTRRFEFEREVRRSDLAPLSRLLALTIATWAEEKTGAIPKKYTPSLATLAQATGMSHASVLQHLKRLESSGWIVRCRPEPQLARSKKARTEYKLTVAARSAADHAISTARSGADLATPSSRPGADLELGQELTGARSGADLKTNKNTKPFPNQDRMEEDSAQEIARWMTATYGKPVDRAHARKVIEQVTDGRHVAHSLLNYVKKAVTKSPDNFLPTYTPPTYRAPASASGVNGYRPLPSNIRPRDESLFRQP